MRPHTLTSCVLRVVVVAISFFSPCLHAELWRAPVYEQQFVQVERRLKNPLFDAEDVAQLPPEQVFEPIPGDIVAALGDDSVDYGSFVTAYLPQPAAEALRGRAQASGLKLALGIRRDVDLPWHSFEVGDVSNRTPRGFGLSVITRPVPHRFLVQFAYPIKAEWVAAFQTCKTTVLAYFQDRTFLVSASNLATLRTCSNSRYFGWIDHYLTTDRVSPEILAEESSSGYSVQFPPGTDIEAKSRSLPESVTVMQGYTFSDSGSVFLRVLATSADLQKIIETDEDLLGVVYLGRDEPSDERQAQIVAGNHNGVSITTPGYRSWLSGRGLLTASNQQTIAIHDTGFDDGTPPSPEVDHHPDLESPERLLGLTNFSTDNNSGDRIGHGTMVAGIIVGDGTAGVGTGAKDPDGFLYGSGVAPGAKIVVSKFTDGNGSSRLGDLTRQSQAFAINRNNPDGTDRAFINNESWNEIRLTTTSPPIYLPVPEYTDKAKYFDDRVVDANESLAGLQAMTIVFAAGNQAYDVSTGTIRRDSVSSPATAKNVISVGATASYRPAPEPPLDCRETPDGARPPNQDALHIARLGLFSGRGKTFSAAGPDKLHNVRVKPDLVAPAIRVFSTVPYNFSLYGIPGYVGCTKFYPDPPVNYHTYGTGTSFSAPVVSGVAALKRKWFLDRGTTPSPSLVKAALLATADTLGNSGLVGNDHRPSPNYGWGRVNLGRLTDSRSRFYVTDNQGLAVSTGLQRTWTRSIGDGTADTYIVLVWSDPSSDVVGSSQAPLKNDLSIAIDEFGGTRSWKGNNFNENVTGNDNGYSYRFSPGEIPLVDSINNVEAIFIPANTFASGQQLTIKITGENVTTGTQKFAIYAYNMQ